MSTPTPDRRPEPPATGSKPAGPTASGPAGKPGAPAGTRTGDKGRRAALVVERTSPWTVLKIAFLLSTGLGIVTVAGAVLLWTVLDVTGGFDQINTVLGGIFGPASGTPFDLRQYLPLTQIATMATIIAVLNMVLVSGLAALGAVLYNISATLVGGIGVTFTDA